MAKHTTAIDWDLRTRYDARQLEAGLKKSGAKRLGRVC